MAQQPLAPNVTIISEMITPALLILASGSLLATVLARLGRVVDRARRLSAGLDDYAKDSPEVVKQTIRLLKRRADCAEYAMSCYYLAVTLFVLTCLLIAADRLLSHALSWAPVVTALGGGVLLFMGSAFMFVECRIAVRQLKVEIAGVWVRMDEGGK